MNTAKEIRLDIGGTAFTITSDDDYLTHLGGTFEPDMVRLFRTLAAGSEVVLDVGANIGCTALLFGGLAKAVHAFEPSPTTFEFLRTNVTRGGRTNVTLHNIGLGAEAGEFALSFAPSNRSGGFVSNQTRAANGHAVETITVRRLDDVAATLPPGRIDFIKIDVEGFEAHVLKGAANTLAAHRPVVALELNHWCLNAFQRTSVPDFFDFLRSVFPVVLAVDGDRYLNLHDANDRFLAMYYHIVKGRFPNIVAAFDEGRLAGFRAAYRAGYEPPPENRTGGGLLSRAKRLVRRVVG